MTNGEINIEQIIEQFHLECSDDHDPKQKQANICKNYQCYNCLRHNVIVDEGILVCQYCQTEYGELIDDNAEWRNYNDDYQSADLTRCETNFNRLLIESSYGTTIGYTKNGYFNHLKQFNNWQSMPYHERSLKTVFDRLTQNGYNCGLTNNIIEFSHKLFAEVIKNQNLEGETKLSRGDIRDGLVAACLFYACKEYGVSRSPREIGKICNVHVSDVTRGIKLFHDLMKNSKLFVTNNCITKHRDFMERYCHNLNIDETMTKEILEIGNKVDELKILTKHTPQAVACGCIYFVLTMHCLNINKSKISEKCGISVPTITKAYEQLLPYTSKLI